MTNTTRKINFSEAKAKQTILTGLVRTVNQDIPNSEDNVIIECGGENVVIPESEIETPPYSNSPVSLVGTDVNFVVTEYVDDPRVIIGSMKIAGERLRKPILEKLYRGDTLEGIITHIVPHGAYVNIGGVSGLLKNSDFSMDGTASISSFYKEFQKIKVKYYRTSNKGNIILKPESVYSGTSLIKFEDFYKDQVCLGKCINIYTDKVYVRVASGIDILCPFPTRFPTIREQDMVRVRIIKVFPEKKRIRGIIIGVLGY